MSLDKNPLNKTYFENLPSDSIFQKLKDYNNTVKPKSFTILYRYITNEPKSQGFKTSILNNDIAQAPDNYFDIIYYTQDIGHLSEVFKEVPIAFKKLKIGGLLYFHGLLEKFYDIIKDCNILVSDVETIYQNSLTPEFIKTDKYILKTVELLSFILNPLTNNQLIVKLVPKTSSHKPALILVKSEPQEEIKPSQELKTLFENIDKQVNTSEKIDKDQFSLSRDIFLSITSGLGIPQEGPKDLIEKVVNSVEYIKGELPEIVKLNESKTPENIFIIVKELLDKNIAYEKDWKSFLMPLIIEYQTALKTTSDIVDDKGDNESEEEESEEEDVDEDDEDNEDEEEESEESEEEEETFQDIEIEESNIPWPGPGFTNLGGFSCFMDSILYGMFVVKDNYFDEQILNMKLTVANTKECKYIEDTKERLEYMKNFQTELNSLANIIRSNKSKPLTCLPIVQIMKKCGQVQSNLMTGMQQDDSEFLRALLLMFIAPNSYPTSVDVTTQLGNDGKTWEEKSVKHTKEPILEVYFDNESLTKPVDVLDIYQSKIITNYSSDPVGEWPIKDGKKYSYRSVKNTIIDSKCLIFHIVRKLIDKKLTNPILFYPSITTPDGDMNLGIVTIHHGGAHGGHYTSYFKYNSTIGDIWFHYDDTQENPIKLATLDEVLSVGSTKCSLLVYYKD